MSTSFICPSLSSETFATLYDFVILAEDDEKCRCICTSRLSAGLLNDVRIELMYEGQAGGIQTPKVNFTQSRLEASLGS
jgi:hypothetical protein